MSRMTATPMPETVGTPACAADPDLMFPMRESARPGAPTTEERRALSLCRRCPVLRPCRAAVLDPGDLMPMAYGVAGGLTGADRRAVRAQQRADAVAEAAEAAAGEAVGQAIASGEGSPPDAAPTAGDPQPAVDPPAPGAPPRTARSAPPLSGSAPSVTPTALAALNGTPSTTTWPADPAPAAPASAPAASAPTPARRPRRAPSGTGEKMLGHGDDVDEVVVGLLRRYPASLADAVTVRELVLERGSATASRWEVAIAAMVMLGRATPVQATARRLGEDSRQVRRWRDRRDAGRPLLPGARGTGTHRLARPARLIATAPPAPAVTLLSASHRGAA